MEFYGIEDCTFEGSDYPDGSHMCCEGHCVVCKDGEWLDQSVRMEKSRSSE
jgi:hypothetical protein